MKKMQPINYKRRFRFDSFGEVLPLFRRIILAGSYAYQLEVPTNYLNLFTNEKEAQNHSELFGEKDKSKWMIFDFY